MPVQLLKTSSTHSTSLVSLADMTWNAARETIIGVGWSPAARLAERAVVRVLQKMKLGQLRITTTSRVYVFGAEESDQPCADQLRCDIRVLNDAFWLRMAFMSDLGFSEAYMYGDIQVSSLVGIFKLFIINRSALSNLSTLTSTLVSLPQSILTSSRFLNTISNSRSNISAHYDISNRMFAAFLSQDMTYSCGIFPSLDDDVKGSDPQFVGCPPVKNGRVNGHSSNGHANGVVNGHAINGHANDPVKIKTVNGKIVDPLYDAQQRKLLHIIRKADIQPGHRVLEIGSGWGSLAILAVQLTGCTVDTLTLSSEQQTLAQERVKAAGLSSYITVHLMDYRNTPKEWEGTFDRFVSIEMIEAVGREFLEVYWRVVDKLLKPTGAVGVVQVITIPEARLEQYTQEVDFIRKWIFPGGFLPSLTLLLSTLTRATSGGLVVDSVSNIGPHYARTLREWRRRFELKFESDIVPALREEYPDVMGDAAGERGREEIEVFRRKWMYYYCYCEIGFTERVLGDHIVTFAREGAVGYGCQVTS